MKCAAVAACAATLGAAAGGPPTAGLPDPATLPWAVRVHPGGALMYLVAHSPVGIEIGKGEYVPAEGGGASLLLDHHQAMYTVSARPLGDANPSAAVPPPTLDEVSAVLTPLTRHVAAGSLVVETPPEGLAYQVRCTGVNCQNGPINVLVRGRVVGTYLVQCLAESEDDTARAAIDAGSRALLDRAAVTERRAVAGNREEAAPVPPKPKAVRTPTTAGSVKGSVKGSAKDSAKGSPSRRTPPVSPDVARLNARAASALAAAQKLQADGNDVSAYEHYKYVVKQYPKTPAADDAAELIATCEADAEFMAKVKAKR